MLAVAVCWVLGMASQVEASPAPDGAPVEPGAPPEQAWESSPAEPPADAAPPAPAPAAAQPASGTKAKKPNNSKALLESWWPLLHLGQASVLSLAGGAVGAGVGLMAALALAVPAAAAVRFGALPPAASFASIMVVGLAGPLLIPAGALAGYAVMRLLSPMVTPRLSADGRPGVGVTPVSGAAAAAADALLHLGGLTAWALGCMGAVAVILTMNQLVPVFGFHGGGPAWPALVLVLVGGPVVLLWTLAVGPVLWVAAHVAGPMVGPAVEELGEVAPLWVSP